jgi:hypothetical protein
VGKKVMITGFQKELKHQATTSKIIGSENERKSQLPLLKEMFQKKETSSQHRKTTERKST